MLEKENKVLFGRINALSALVISLFILIFLLSSYYFFLNKSVEVLLHVETDISGTLKFYWKNKAGGFREKKSSLVDIVPEKTEYHFKIAPYIAIDRLRLDLLDRPGEVRLKELILYHPAYEPFFPIARISSSQKRHQIGLVDQTSDGGLTVTTVGSDPFIEIEVAPEKKLYLIFYIFLVSLAGGLLLSLLMDTALLKGSISQGRVVVFLPGSSRQKAAEIFAAIFATKTGNGCQLLAIEERNGAQVYTFSFSSLVDRDIMQLSKELRRRFPNVEYRFQYIRSGEV